MEYEKVRYDKLNQVVQKAVEHTIKKLLMPEQVNKCFPTISETGPETLETAITQIQNYFHVTCFKQVEHIFNERDLGTKLDQLDEIIQLAQRAREKGTRKQIQVDQLKPEEIIQARLGEAKQDTERKLEMIYEQLVFDNQTLFKELKNIAKEAGEVLQNILLLLDELLGGVDDEKMSEFEDNLKHFELHYALGGNYDMLFEHS